MGTQEVFRVREVIRFRFSEPVERQEVEDDVCLAIFAVECLFGAPRVRLELAGFLVSEDGSCCVLDVCGPAGEAAARVFTGLTTTRVGGGALNVERVAP